MDNREAPRMSSSEPPNMMMKPSYQNNLMGMPNASSMMSNMNTLSFNQMDGSGGLYLGDSSVPGLKQCGVLSMSSSEPAMKKKRGRPRKYGPDGNMALALRPISSSSGYSNPNSSSTMNPSSGEPNVKKRGRPLGSGRKQQLDTIGSAGIAFTPHVITVEAGEDIGQKIFTFSQQGPRTVCILSASGAISNVTLRQPATSGGTVTYEGRFQIISLSGSYMLTEEGGTRGRTGGLSVALSGSDGRVLGGSVAGMLKAANPVQVVMGSFITEGKKPKPEPRREPSSVPPPHMVGFGAPSASSPPSQGSSSQSDDDNNDDDDNDDDDDDDDHGSPAMNLSGAYNSSNNNNNSSHLMPPPYGSVDGWAHAANHHPRHG